MKFTLLAFLTSLLGLVSVQAQEPPAANPAIREISPGIFEIGQIRLDQKARSVTFPVTVNKAGKDDLLEYLLVNADGQTHESLLFTAVVPTDLHFAMLLLGAKGAGDSAGKPEELGGGQINSEFLKRAPKLTLSMSWPLIFAFVS